MQRQNLIKKLQGNFCEIQEKFILLENDINVLLQQTIELAPELTSEQTKYFIELITLSCDLRRKLKDVQGKEEIKNIITILNHCELYASKSH